MPEVIFTVQLPSGETKRCYSPSSVVHDYFKTGEIMSVTEFTNRSRNALTEASERVRKKFGFSCTSAAAQLDEIEHFTSTQPPNATVRIVDI
ncbi:MSMEG_0570 family nitrogen starvation response protein [Phragmitibacter flavus]|uniref:MSMEG_0570 family nitrogen starvation response protein n=1 Tax=Phragmitibacter flavus TaxID=2576071 RepID=A0A5R8K9F4_9BACT|nr:MSMEG_0570 family nitrogen starvation response protein [Phragmitibacter flavus]TLD68938.1 MSMEG_0570 family nitrogen starvation response protein [Phragmitibacter flavus]